MDEEKKPEATNVERNVLMLYNVRLSSVFDNSHFYA